jgi:hypothetical protein
MIGRVAIRRSSWVVEWRVVELTVSFGLCVQRVGSSHDSGP